MRHEERIARLESEVLALQQREMMMLDDTGDICRRLEKLGHSATKRDEQLIQLGEQVDRLMAVVRGIAKRM